MGNKTTSTPSIYKPQYFSKEHQLYAKHGSTPSRRQLRQFNKYWESDQRYFDEILHDRREIDKMFESGYRNLEYLRNKYKTKPITKVTNTPIKSLESKYKDKIKINDYWTNIAKNNGFASMYEVAEWQSKNGLVVDGKFGTKSASKMRALKTTPTNSTTSTTSVSEVSEVPKAPKAPVAPTSTPQTSQPELSVPADGVENSSKMEVRMPKIYTLQDLYNSDYFYEPSTPATYKYNKLSYIMVGGKVYGVVQTNGNFSNNASGILPRAYYAYDFDTHRIKRLRNRLLGDPYTIINHNSKYGDIFGGAFADGAKWRDPDTLFTALKQQGGVINKKFNYFKQGGNMRYFQQGGAAPQNNIQEQIVALVQAAAQGDEQATKQITQIMEAAKSGNKQAIQLAQMIQQTIEQMKSQATAAKWGAKLGYIKSLKYAKGGKTCPACAKKVKKHETGGPLSDLFNKGVYHTVMGMRAERDAVTDGLKSVVNTVGEKPGAVRYIYDNAIKPGLQTVGTKITEAYKDMTDPTWRAREDHNRWKENLENSERERVRTWWGNEIDTPNGRIHVKPSEAEISDRMHRGSLR